MVTKYFRELLKEIQTYGELSYEEKETLEIGLLSDVLSKGKELYDKVKVGADAKSALENYSEIKVYKLVLDKFLESDAAKKEKYKPIINKIIRRYELTETLNMFYLALNEEDIVKMRDEYTKIIRKIHEFKKENK